MYIEELRAPMVQANLVFNFKVVLILKQYYYSIRCLHLWTV